MIEYPVRFTFKLPQIGAYVGPPSMDAGVAEVGESGIMLRIGHRTERPRELRFGLSEIQSVVLKTGLFGNRLVVQAKEPASIASISNNEQGTLILKIPRGELEAARQAESLLKTRLAHHSESLKVSGQER